MFFNATPQYILALDPGSRFFRISLDFVDLAAPITVGPAAFQACRVVGPGGKKKKEKKKNDDNNNNNNNKRRCLSTLASGGGPPVTMTSPWSPNLIEALRCELWKQSVELLNLPVASPSNNRWTETSNS